MALLDIFRKKEKEEKPEKKEVEKKVEKKEVKQPTKKVTKGKKAEDASIYAAIEHQHISEKASNLMSLNKYTFKVFPRANKDMVRKAIEKLYGVKVKSVNMITLPSKSVRLGKHEGVKGGFKKAIVTLYKGHTIDIAPH